MSGQNKSSAQKRKEKRRDKESRVWGDFIKKGVGEEVMAVALLFVHIAQYGAQDLVLSTGKTVSCPAYSCNCRWVNIVLTWVAEKQGTQQFSSFYFTLTVCATVCWSIT